MDALRKNGPQGTPSFLPVCVFRNAPTAPWKMRRPIFLSPLESRSKRNPKERSYAQTGFPQSHSLDDDGEITNCSKKYWSFGGKPLSFRDGLPHFLSSSPRRRSCGKVEDRPMKVKARSIDFSKRLRKANGALGFWETVTAFQEAAPSDPRSSPTPRPEILPLSAAKNNPGFRGTHSQ